MLHLHSATLSQLLPEHDHERYRADEPVRTRCAKNEEVRVSREVGCNRHTVARGGTLAWSLAALADKLVSLMSSSREAEWFRTVSKEEMSDCE